MVLPTRDGSASSGIKQFFQQSVALLLLVVSGATRGQTTSHSQPMMELQSADARAAMNMADANAARGQMPSDTSILHHYFVS
jgi:hypothetical protein